MIKYYCDCCRKETDNLYPIPYLCHIRQVLDGDTSLYYDMSLQQPVSGRYEYINVCLKCYNNIMVTSVKKFRELKSVFGE